MRIAIIVAMDKELRLLRPLLGAVEHVEIDGQCYDMGRIGQHDIIATKCGIGKVNAAVGTVTLIDHFKPHYVINTGVAGGADKSVSVMDIVVGRQVAYHDVWCGPETPWGAIQGLPLYYDAAPELLSLVPKCECLHEGLICSGDQFIDTVERFTSIKNLFPNALALDMESAAIAQVCHLRGVGFMSLRVISDSPGAGHDNTNQYTDFWQAAPEHTFDVLRQMLQSPVGTTTR